jgi:aminopeptidase N
MTMVALERDKDQTNPDVKYLSDYQPTGFVIEHVHLHFDLHEEQTLVRAILRFRRNPKAKTHDADLRLDGEGLELREIALNGKPLADDRYSTFEAGLLVKEVPDQFDLETLVMIKPQENTELMGLYKSSGNYCTQCEPEGFRRITYFLDRPDVMTLFTTTITADKQKYPMLLSNGNLIEERELEDGRHWVHWEDPSLKPCYLFALVAGHFDLIEDKFVTMSGREVKLALFLEQGFKDHGDFAMQSLIRSMKWDEEVFGREYDLDIYMIVAVSDFNMGAMENKGLNVFNTKYVLARTDTATDMDYANIERVIGHEYFHNWSGNRVTCRDWFQITLKEGLTVLREQLFCEDMTSHAMVRIQTANTIRTVQFAQDAGPMSHPIRPEQYIEINNFYTVTVYEKGSEVIRMVRTLIGPELFRQAMDAYFARFDGQAVTTEDFLAVMEAVSGRDLSQFKRWYQQGGTPELTVVSEYDEVQQSLKLIVTQHCPKTPGPGQDHKQPFELPLSIGFLSESGEMTTQLQGEDQALTGTRVLDITQAHNEYVFVNVTERPALSLLRDFSAPVKLHYAYSDEELLRLIAHDSDAFARWEAAQTYFSRLILAGVDAMRHEKAAEFTLDERFVAVLRQLLADTQMDPQLLGMMLTLPAQSYLLQLLPEADVSHVHEMHVMLGQRLAAALESEWLANYQRLAPTGGYTFNTQEMGRRFLRAVCLRYLNCLDNAAYRKLALEQFECADNMTDVMAALHALNDVASDEREQALATFHAKWQHEPLVMGKWLMLQASSPAGQAQARVQAIMESDDFDLLNPNKVRALLGSFAANLLHFHALDGSGYQLLADAVMALDPHNRLTAARLCEPLIRWQHMDVKRQRLMKVQLQRILDLPGLSNDTFEVVSKSLAMDA